MFTRPIPQLLKSLGKGMGEVENRVKFRITVMASSKNLGGSSVEQHLQQMKQV